MNKTPLPADVLARLPRTAIHRRAGHRLQRGRCRRGAGAGNHRHQHPDLRNGVGGAVRLRPAAGAVPHVRLHADAVRAGEWSRSPDWCFWKSPLVELAGKTMGDRRLRTHRPRRGPHCRRHGHARHRQRYVPRRSPAYPGFRWAALDELLRESGRGEPARAAVAETQGMIHARHARADEALGVPDQHFARARWWWIRTWPTR